jgi:hypothetical protein
VVTLRCSCSVRSLSARLRPEADRSLFARSGSRHRWRLPDTCVQPLRNPRDKCRKIWAVRRPSISEQGHAIDKIQR